MLSKKMKTFLPILLLVMATIGCNNSDLLNSDGEFVALNDEVKILKANDSDLSKEEKELVQKISESLAVRYVNEQHPDETEIAPLIVDYFYNGLVHFYNSDLEEVKTVTDEYSLVVPAPADAREVLIWVDLSQDWLDSWRNGQTQTGVSEIDELIAKFDLQLVRYRELEHTTNNAVANMKSGNPLNVYAVGALFSELPQIENAGPDGYLTGGRNVKAEVNANYLLLDITVGSGDCPSGCINKINYQFRVFSDGRVEIVT